MGLLDIAYHTLNAFSVSVPIIVTYAFPFTFYVAEVVSFAVMILLLRYLPSKNIKKRIGARFNTLLEIVTRECASQSMVQKEDCFIRHIFRQLIIKFFYKGEGVKLRRLAVCSLVLMFILSGTILLKPDFTAVADYGSSETIQILSDGSVSPSDAPIQSVDNVTYVLLDNIQYVGTGNAVEILRDGVVFEGNGFSLEGNGTGVGIYVRGFTNGQTAVKNVTIQNFDVGIKIEFAAYNYIQGNKIFNSTTMAIEVLDSVGNEIYENEIEDCAYGIYIGPSTYYGANSVHLNNITNANTGIYCRSPVNDLILNTISLSNVSGITVTNSYGNQLYSNAVSDCRGFSGIQVSNSPDCWLMYNNVTNNLIGVSLSLSNNTIMEGNTFFNDGLFVLNSYHNSLYNNYVNNKPLVYLEDASYGTVNYAGQVVLVNCENIQINNLELNKTTHGIELFNSRYCVISQNRIFENSIGLYLYGSSENTILENDISFNEITNVLPAYSSDNLFYHNNFINAAGYNVHDILNTSINVWDIGYPYGGNYWSDYNGTDANGDGIGDSPYTIDVDNVDNYPLMVEYGSSVERSFNVTVGETHYVITIVSNSTVTDLSFNLTLKQLSFNVTGTSGTTGFCNITVSAELMSGDFTLYLDGVTLVEGVDYVQSFNGTHYMFSVTYMHSGHIIEIVSTNVVPDFASWLFLPFLMSATLSGLFFKKRLKKKIKF